MDTVTRTPGNNRSTVAPTHHWVGLVVALIAAVFLPFIGALIAAAICVWLYRTGASRSLVVTCLAIALFFAAFYLVTTPVDQLPLV